MMLDDMTAPDAAMVLTELWADFPYLMGRASREGHEVGQALAVEWRLKLHAALSAMQPALDAAREAGVREGLERAAAACDAERLGWTHNAPQAAGAIAAAGCRDAIRALLPVPARAADAAAGEASDGR